jgi:hypothetical protein
MAARSHHSLRDAAALELRDTETRWILRKNLEETSQNFRTVWDLYLKSYTVFLTFNIVAMAWLFGDKTKVPKGWPLYFIVAVFATQCVLTGITSGLVAEYSGKTQKILEKAKEQLLVHARELVDAGIECGGGLPIGLGQWGGWANCVSSFLLMIAWIGLAIIADKTA